MTDPHPVRILDNGARAQMINFSGRAPVDHPKWPLLHAYLSNLLIILSTTVLRPLRLVTDDNPHIHHSAIATNR